MYFVVELRHITQIPCSYVHATDHLVGSLAPSVQYLRTRVLLGLPADDQSCILDRVWRAGP